MPIEIRDSVLIINLTDYSYLMGDDHATLIQSNNYNDADILVFCSVAGNMVSIDYIHNTEHIVAAKEEAEQFFFQLGLIVYDE